MFSRRSFILTLLIASVLVGTQVGVWCVSIWLHGREAPAFVVNLFTAYAVVAVILGLVPGYCVLMAQWSRSPDSVRSTQQILKAYVAAYLIGAIGVGIWVAAAERHKLRIFTDWYRPETLPWAVIALLGAGTMLGGILRALLLIRRMWKAGIGSEQLTKSPQ